MTFSGKKRQVSYGQFEDIMERLSQQIINSGKKFDMVYGIPRGGLPIAVHLSHRLGLTYYSDRNTELPPPNTETLLIVDDIVDEGTTMLWVKQTWTKASTASLFIKPHAVEGSLPDFYVYETIDWVVFPWEVFEDKPNRERYKEL